MMQAQTQYGRDAVLSATPARLVTMLYDRLMIDLYRAEQAQLVGEWTVASTNLIHAQEIVAELAGSLRVDLWDGAEGLLAVYNYITSALRTANIQRDPAGIREALDLLEPLAAAWHEAAALPSGPVARPEAVAADRPGGLDLGFA
ncbi:MAG: flagellar export chaperone FliS [Leifsonia sp.]